MHWFCQAFSLAFMGPQAAKNPVRRTHLAGGLLYSTASFLLVDRVIIRGAVVLFSAYNDLWQLVHRLVFPETDRVWDFFI